MTDRTIAGGMLAALQADEHRPIRLMEFQFDGGTLRYWTGVGDLSWDGKTWEGSGHLLQADKVEETIDDKATGAAWVLSGIPSALIAVAEDEDYQERPAAMWLAEIDGTGAIVSDPVKDFAGRMDVMTTTDQGETCTIGLTAESRVIDQDRPNRRDVTHEDQLIDYPADLGMEFVARMQDVQLKWGPS